MIPLLIALKVASAGLLASAIVAAFRWYETGADEAVRFTHHVRRVAFEQAAREAELLPAADAGVRQRMLAGVNDAGQPIPSNWRW